MIAVACRNWLADISSEPCLFVFELGNSDIRQMRKAMLYARESELAKRLTFVAICGKPASSSSMAAPGGASVGGTTATAGVTCQPLNHQNVNTEMKNDDSNGYSNDNIDSHNSNIINHHNCNNGSLSPSEFASTPYESDLDTPINQPNNAAGSKRDVLSADLQVLQRIDPKMKLDLVFWEVPSSNSPLLISTEGDPELFPSICEQLDVSPRRVFVSCGFAECVHEARIICG